MIISFSGLPGSGKSGVARRLATELGCPYYDMGTLRRSIAAEKGLTLEEYNKLGEDDPSTDTEVDNYQATLGRQQDNFVVVGRTSWHFIPHSLKIFLSAPLEVGAERIFKDTSARNEAADMNSIEAVLAGLKRRLESDRYRYDKYFGIDVYDEKNYDWVLDTSDLNQEEVYIQVLNYVKIKIEEGNSK